MVSTDSSSAPLVVVVGATGNQGGSVINALLESPREYRLRGFTRDVSKEKAKALTSKGVEMVAADISNIDESVKQAFEGANIVYIMTNYWEHTSKQREITEGQNILTYVSTIPTVDTVIWSGLENVTEISHGRYTLVEHFDGKSIITSFGKSLFESSSIKFINVEPGFFASNFTSGTGTFYPQKQEDGTLVIKTPMRPQALIPVIDIAGDYGIFVRGAIEEGEVFYGKEKQIFTFGEMISMEDVAIAVGKVLNKKVIYDQIPDEEHLKTVASRGIPEKIALELFQMMKFIQDYGYYGTKLNPKSVIVPETLARSPKSLEEYLRANQSAFEKLLN